MQCPGWRLELVAVSGLELVAVSGLETRAGCRVRAGAGCRGDTCCHNIGIEATESWSVAGARELGSGAGVLQEKGAEYRL